jgi:DNA primase
VIPQAFIQDLLGRVDVADVVGRYVKLKKAGANLLGLCPFHGEKSPSFTVSPTKQFYHCFGCGAHGSAIGFLMEFSGLSYVDAIQELAQSAGLQVPREANPLDAQQVARNQDAAQVLEAACRFYKARLKQSPHAIAYLKKRGLSGEIAARFAIGYAPEAWQGLQAAVNDYGSEALLTAGLVIQRDAQEAAEPGARGAPARRYDRFRDRIMFPIRTARGQVIGFGGRILDKGEPKYLNSPETPLFVKGRELYGLYEGRQALRDKDTAIVVEGYMDVVMLAQHGIGYAVATLGTATTADHLRKLLRQVERVVFCFDGDNAGRKAAWRALETSLPFADDAKRIDFLFLPPEHDPDTFVQAHGAAAFEAKLAQATSLSTFLIEELTRRNGLETAEDRSKILAQAKPLMQQLPPAALRLQIEAELARVCQLSAQQVAGLMEQGASAAPKGSAFAPASQALARSGERHPQPAAARRATRAPLAPSLMPQVLELLASFPSLARSVDDDLLPAELVQAVEIIASLPAQASSAAVLEALKAQAHPGAEHLATRLSSPTKAVAMTEPEAASVLTDALAQLRIRSVRARLEAVSARLAQGTPSQSDKEESSFLAGELARLKRRPEA